VVAMRNTRPVVVEAHLANSDHFAQVLPLQDHIQQRRHVRLRPLWVLLELRAARRVHAHRAEQPLCTQQYFTCLLNPWQVQATLLGVEPF
jgi:hypothetical protein